MTATRLTRLLLQGLRRPRRSPAARPDFGDCGAELALDMTLATRPLLPAAPAAAPASPIDPTPGRRLPGA
jgi:hypothetical protein